MIALALTWLASAGASAAVAGVPYLGALVEFLGTRLGRALMGVTAIAIVVMVAYHKGENAAEARCDAEALRVQVALLNRTIETLNGRAARSAAVLQKLGVADADDQAQLNALVADIAKLKLQPTTPGAKHDPDAILDDRCNLTDRGAARGLRHR